jgi:hypothetical protein
MSVHYKNGKIEFDLHDVLSRVSLEQKLELIESLACDDQIITHVAQQIISEWTESGYKGASSIDPPPNPFYGLDWAWREVAKRSGEVAEREIERLEECIARNIADRLTQDRVWPTGMGAIK